MDTTNCTPLTSFKPAAGVEQRARALIEEHSYFVGRGRMFEYEYRDEVLFVRGTVPTYYLKQMLQRALRDLDGVHRVENQVSVAASDGVFDPAVRNDLY
jgi:hypothetical protein